MNLFFQVRHVSPTKGSVIALSSFPMKIRFFLATAFVLLFSASSLANDEPIDAMAANPAMKEASGLIDDGRYEEARLALGTLLAEDPESAGAWNLLGYLERRLQNYEQALNNYGKALSLDDAHTGALHYQAETYLELGRLEDAEKNLSRLGAACSYLCDDYNDLVEAVALYKKNRGV